eukprot:gene6123-6589_t
MEFVNILPFLYLSNLESVNKLIELASQDDVKPIHEELEENIEQAIKVMKDTKLVISLGCELNSTMKLNQTSFYSFPEYLDSPDTYLLSLFLKLLPIIHDHLTKSESVIIHCVYGQSRSVALILCYMLHFYTKKYDLRSAYKHIEDKKPNICVNPGFLTQLFFYHDYCISKGLVKEVPEALEMESDSESSIHSVRESNETVFHTRQLILELLNDTYQSFQQFPSFLRLSPQLNNNQVLGEIISESVDLNSNYLYCNSCREPIIQTSLLLQIKENCFIPEIIEDLTDEFWKSYRYPLVTEFVSLLYPSLEQPKPRKGSNANKGKDESKILATITKEGIFPIQEELKKDYYVLARPLSSLWLSISPNETRKGAYLSSRCQEYCCKNCRRVIGKSILKAYPVFGKYCTTNLYLLIQKECRLR